MGDNATGTVTFLFTDIEGSTERWQRDPGAMSDGLAAHDATLRAVIERHGGLVFKHTGDGVCAVFSSASAAAAAAVEAQSDLVLPVRMGLHTGEAERRDGDYFGPTLNRAARVMDAGHGGQVLVSSATAGLVRDLELVDLGDHHLKGLQITERIFQVGRGEFPALRTPEPVVGNLPVELSTFVGRSHEVKAVVDDLADHRLVTLIGVGGTGKTRLAVKTGFVMADSFPGGCWMVELAAVTVEDAVPYAIAAGVGVTAPPDGDVIDHVIARLRRQRVLMIVDNCEHLLGATADAVERIVTGCHDVTVLATSREPLMVRGERLFPVPSLSTDEAEQLFLERARDEAPDLVIDAAQAIAVTELCRRLDGLPLALELAASRVRALTPVELVTNLEERFRLLVGGRRTRMERHQTMRGTLDWSYDLCSDAEQAVFDRLSVFPAGFDLAAARAVAAGDGIDEIDVVDVVSQLVDRSLLQRSTAPDGTTRYRMLETMRAYAREHLQHAGTSDAIRARHARHTGDTLSALALRSVGPDEEVVSRGAVEHLADALVALHWCIDHHEWELAMRVVQIGWILDQRETDELAALLNDALLESGEATALRDELQRRDRRMRLRETRTASVERGLRTIRSRPEVPRDRTSWPPQYDFQYGGYDNEVADELAASLDHYVDAPPIVRYLAGFSTIRSLTSAGHLDHVDELLRDFDLLVSELGSRIATANLAYLRGRVAAARHDWAAAAGHFAQIRRPADGEQVRWFDLTVAWHTLRYRALSENPLAIAGSDLVEPWRWYRAEPHLVVLRQHGAVTTALALRRLGVDDLADRFAAWAARDAESTPMEPFDDHELAAGGLTMRRIDPPDDLDTLVDELFIVADELDRRIT